MDKAQGLNFFWNSFGVPAFDENTVPQTAPMPRITYSVATDSLDNVVYLSASIWYKDDSWQEITQKVEEIEKTLGEHGGVVLPLNQGLMYIYKGSPFSQRMSDPDDNSIRRIYMNIRVEFLTAY